MLQIRNISKSYSAGKTIALDKVSLDIKQGELFGLIGPDGAGKTTLFRILTTLLLPDSGQVNMMGLDVVKNYAEVRKEIGYMPGKFSLYQDLTVEENLHFFATLFNTTIQENRNLIDDIYRQLEPFKDRKAGKLSGGMKQKLALCCSLIHKPSLLLLDEPTTGVDTVSRKEFWQMLKNLKNQGITILVSTPYMDEASLCERIALIQQGKILSVNTPESICAAYPDPLFAIHADGIPKLLKTLRNHPEIKSCYSFGEDLHVSLHHPELLQDLLIEIKKNIPDITAKPIAASVEDCFIQLMETHE